MTRRGCTLAACEPHASSARSRHAKSARIPVLCGRELASSESLVRLLPKFRTPSRPPTPCISPVHPPGLLVGALVLFPARAPARALTPAPPHLGRSLRSRLPDSPAHRVPVRTCQPGPSDTPHASEGLPPCSPVVNRPGHSRSQLNPLALCTSRRPTPCAMQRTLASFLALARATPAFS